MATAPRALPQPEPALRAVLYLRSSTEEQQLGPEAQQAALLAWCEAHGAAPSSVHLDLGISGGAPLDRRPALLEALGQLEPGSVLLVAKRDRLARDTFSAAMIERLAAKAGARIVSADGAGNGDGPEALLMRRMIDAFAEYERALIRSRTRSALQAKRSRGERCGNLPLGFTVSGDGRALEADANEQATLAQVRALRAEGLTLKRIAERLNADGKRTRSGGPWHPSAVHRALAAGPVD